MNVLYISYDGALDPLGFSQIRPYLIDLSAKGANFTFLTFEKKERLKDFDKVKKYRAALEEKNIKWEALRYHKSPSVPATAFDILAGLIRGSFIVLRDRIEFIHARSFVGAVPALLLAKLFNLKFIFDMRGFWPDERIDGYIWKKKGLLYKIAKWWEMLFLLNADSIVCLTHEAKKLALDFPYLKKREIFIDVIPTCVDIDKFTIKDKERELLEKLNLNNRLIFIYFGSIGTWYMLEEMVDFFKMAKQINQGSFFLILTPDKNTVRNTMISKGIAQEDYLIDQVSYKDIPRWIALADTSISFIRPGPSKKSSCPTKFAESLSCGVPVIINPGIGDTEKIVKDYGVGVVVEEFKEGEYIKAINRLLKISKDKDILKRKSRKVAEDFFSLKNGVERYWEIYQRLNLYLPNKDRSYL